MDYFERIEKRLDMPLADVEQAIRELRSHYAAIIDELKESGVSEAEAEREAAKRLGDPEEIAAGLSTAHHCASWKTALIAGLPCLAVIVFKGGPAIWRALDLQAPTETLIAGLPLICLTLIFLIGSMSRLRGFYRPAWLASWLAMALVGVSCSSQLLASALVEHHFRVMGSLDPTGDYARFIHTLPALFLVAAIVALYLLTFRWRGVVWLAVLGFGTWALWQSMGGFYDTLGLLSFAVYVLLLAATAVGAFARHPSGRTSDATVLVFLGLSALSIETPWRQVQENLLPILVYLAGLSLVLATSVVLHARAGSSARKAMSLAAGIVAFFGVQAVALATELGVSVTAQIAVFAGLVALLAFGLPHLAHWRLSFRLAIARLD